MSAAHAFQTDHPMRFGPMILRFSTVLLVLLLLKILLTLPGNVGPEEFLGFTPADRIELDAVGEAWHSLALVRSEDRNVSLRSAALWYFALDTMFFVPAYGALVLRIARRIAARAEGNRARARAGAYLAILTIVLMGVDVAENASGLARVGVAGMSFWMVWGYALLSPIVAYFFWQRYTKGALIVEQLSALGSHWSRIRGFLRIMIWLGLMLGLLSIVLTQAASVQDHGLALGAALHTVKQALMGLTAATLLLFGLLWLFKPHDRHAEVAVLRHCSQNMLWRARYVLLALLILATLTVIMDQCRDVAIGMVDGFAEDGVHMLAALVMAVSVVAVWAMSFSCWLWTRLAFRMQGPLPHERPETAAQEHTLQKMARSIARAFGIMPAFLAATMSAYAARDAVWAASLRTDGVSLSPLLLIVFGALSLAGGVAFVWGRDRAYMRSKSAEDYYDDPKLADDWIDTLDRRKYRFLGLRGSYVVLLPVIALALAVALRAASVLLDPKLPLAFPVIVFSLTAWLGFFSWMALKEQRESRPWIILILIAIGGIGFWGLSDNHIVRLIDAPLRGGLPFAWVQVLGSTLLAACVIGAALLIFTGRRAAERSKLHWNWVLPGAAVLAVTVIVAVGWSSRRGVPACEATGCPPASRPIIEDAFGNWTQELRGIDAQLPENDPFSRRVFIVTSEGGGIRAAYWTARTLQKLSEQIPAFNERTFMLSGVSGGAVGEAVYVGCLRGASTKRLAECIEHFGKTDLLTPMLGAWMFEDAVARVVPTSSPRGPIDLCPQPGCGFMSRGLWFEQALERGVPKLSEGIAYADANSRHHVPHLFLNSTWVESGDRAIASGVKATWERHFASARDEIIEASPRGQDSSLEIDIPLSAAAHNAARFPFVNALGVLRGADGVEGHLADGGYFDNSGAHTGADALAALRSWISQHADCRGVMDPDCGRRADWLKSLRPTVIVIQNGISLSCTKDIEVTRRVDCLRIKWRLKELAPEQDIYIPERPRDAASWQLYVDAIGPLVTMANVGGTGANGRRAEALLKRACQRFSPDQEHCVARLAQRDDGILYPLGWYLSRTAQAALDLKATSEVHKFVEGLKSNPVRDRAVPKI